MSIQCTYKIIDVGLINMYWYAVEGSRRLPIPQLGCINLHTTHNLPLLQLQRRWWRWIISQIQEGFYEPEPMKTLSNALIAMSDNGWLMDAGQAIKRWWVSDSLTPYEREMRQQAEENLCDLDAYYYFEYYTTVRGEPIPMGSQDLHRRHNKETV